MSNYPNSTTWLDSTNALQNPIITSSPTNLGSFVAAWLIASPRSGNCGTSIASVTVAAASAPAASGVSVTLALYGLSIAASGLVAANETALSTYTLTGVSLSATPAYLTISPPADFAVDYATYPVGLLG